MKKFKLTRESKVVSGAISVFRIQALIPIKRHGVKAGDLGGWVEKEENLSQDDDAWVSGDACVFGDGRVCGDALVCEHAKVYGKGSVYGSARISGNAEVYYKGNVSGDAEVCENAQVHGDSWVSGKAKVFGNAHVAGDAEVCGNAKVHGRAIVSGNVEIHDCAEVFGSVQVCGEADISGNAKVGSDKDYMVFRNTWSSGRWFTYTRSDKKWRVGCFSGTGKELVKQAYRKSERCGRGYEASVRYMEALEALSDETEENHDEV